MHGQTRESRTSAEAQHASRNDLTDLVKPTLDPIKAAWLWTMILSALLIGLSTISWTSFGIAALIAFPTLCIGHSVGLHRGIIHQSYRMPRWVFVLLSEIAALTGMGGPLSWARYHAVRDYWQNHAAPPSAFRYDHSILRDFWLVLHCRFEASSDASEQAEADRELLAAHHELAISRLPKGLLEDRWLRFLECTWPLHTLALAIIVALTLGPSAIPTVICGRIAGGLLVHWFVAYAGHVWGERRAEVEGARESGTNVWVLGVMTFGEGFHSNHHVRPNAAQIGERWWEFDVGWYVIWCFAKLGLVRDVLSFGDARAVAVEASAGSSR